MKIAILGYGRMGKEVEQAALEKGHEIVARIDHENDWDEQSELLRKADVAIEFSTAQNAPENIMRCFEVRLPVVSGTTGWLERMDEIRAACEEKKASFFYAPNFSIGVNVFFGINKYLAGSMKGLQGYEISIQEEHHIHKADSPSGTAIRLAQDIMQTSETKRGWTSSDKSDNDEISISSLREGNIPGTHTVLYESEHDIIQIKHVAKSRKGFAAGAVMAAGWLIGKTGFFGMNDLIKTHPEQ